MKKSTMLLFVLALLITACGHNQKGNIQTIQPINNTPTSAVADEPAKDLEQSIAIVKNAKNYPLSEALFALTSILKVKYSEYDRLQVIIGCLKDQALYDELRAACTLALYFFDSTINHVTFASAYEALEWALQNGSKKQQEAVYWILGTSTSLAITFGKYKIFEILQQNNLPISLNISIIEQFWKRRKLYMTQLEIEELKNILLTYMQKQNQSKYSLGMSLQLLLQMDASSFSLALHSFCSNNNTAQCPQLLELMKGSVDLKRISSTNTVEALFYWSLENNTNMMLSAFLQLPNEYLTSALP